MIRRSAVAQIVVLGCALLVAGCGKQASHSGKTKDSDGDTTPELPNSVNAQDVTFELYSAAPSHQHLYTVHSKQVSVSIAQKTHPDGTGGTPELEQGVAGKVTGKTYQDGGSDFSADYAKAEKSSKSMKQFDVLTLVGHVVLRKSGRGGTIQCDRLRIEQATHLFKAKGHVYVRTSDGIVGTLSEAWAKQDFSRISTPALFNEKL